MGIAMLTLSGLVHGWTALQRLTQDRQDRLDHARQRPARGPRMGHPVAPRTAVPLGLTAPLRRPRPSALRVLRVCDDHPLPGEVGRLRISGRMSDVCAELDRLAAQEAAIARH